MNDTDIKKETIPNIYDKCYKINDVRDINSKKVETFNFLKFEKFLKEEDFDNFSDFLMYEYYILQKLESGSFDHYVKLNEIYLLESDTEGLLLRSYEYFNISLEDILFYKKQNNSPFKENELLSLFKHLLKIIFDLRSNYSLAHRNINLSNFFYDFQKKKFKLGNFSTAIVFPEDEEKNLEICGTPFYFNDNIYKNFSKQNYFCFYNPYESDLYAFGILCLCLKKLTLPKDFGTRENVKKEISNLKGDSSLSSKIICDMFFNGGTYFSLYKKLSDYTENINYKRTMTKIISEKKQIMEKLENKAFQNYSCGLLCFKLNLYNQAIDKLKISYDIYKELDDKIKLGQVCYFLGIIYYKLNMNEFVIEFLETNLAKLKDSLTPAEIIKVLIILGDAKFKLNQLFDAVLYYEESVILIKETSQIEDRYVAELYERIGDVYKVLNIKEKSLKFWSQAQSIYNNTLINEEKVQNCERVQQKFLNIDQEEILNHEEEKEKIKRAARHTNISIHSENKSMKGNSLNHSKSGSHLDILQDLFNIVEKNLSIHFNQKTEEDIETSSEERKSFDSRINIELDPSFFLRKENQSLIYEKIKNKCHTLNKRFKDPSFLPGKKSLTQNWEDVLNKQRWKKYFWMKADSIYDHHTLFEENLNHNSIKIKKGALENSYFLSALAAMMEKPNLIKKNFHELELNKAGIYGIFWNVEGKRKLIILDDYFPCFKKNKQPAFGRGDNNEIWIMLFEKAYAKLYGSYENIEGGCIETVLNEISGAPVENRMIVNEDENNWDYIKNNLEKGLNNIIFN